MPLLTALFNVHLSVPCVLLLCLLVTIRGHSLVTLIITTVCAKQENTKEITGFFVVGMCGISFMFSCNPRIQDHVKSGIEALITFMGGEGGVFVAV